MSNVSSLIIEKTRIPCILLLIMALIGCSIAYGQSSNRNSEVDLSIGQEQYPDADAIILRWEQHWTIDDDGSTSYREHKWTKLLNSRPIRSTADPRLDYCKGEDELIIHAAQTILPNGEILPVPDYSFNIAAPDDVAGWPAYTNWEQTVVSFSGIEPNATLELDYEIKTKAGSLAWIFGDIRLDDQYPIVTRVIKVTLSPKYIFNYTPIKQNQNLAPVIAKEGDRNTYTWVCGPFAGNPHEPQSPPWYEQSPRLQWSCNPDTSNWVDTLLRFVSAAAKPSQNLKDFATNALDSETNTTEMVKKLSSKMKNRFNLIGSYKTYRSFSCRDAETVFSSNYGNPLEAGALYLALFRSLGMEAVPYVAVDTDLWSKDCPSDKSFAGLVIAVKVNGKPIYVHPTAGIVETTGTWGGHTLLRTQKEDGIKFVDRGETSPSQLSLTGTIDIDDNGNAKGNILLSMTGAFYDPASLKTTSSQKKFIESSVNRFSNQLQVTSFDLENLSAENLRATIAVKTEDGLLKLDNTYVLEIPATELVLHEFPLPLNRSYRTMPVRTNGAFTVSIDITVKLPAKWSIKAHPKSQKTIGRKWGEIYQTVELKNGGLSLQRQIRLLTNTISPQNFTVIRDSINRLRASDSTIIAVGP